MHGGNNNHAQILGLISVNVHCAGVLLMTFHPVKGRRACMEVKLACPILPHAYAFVWDMENHNVLYGDIRPHLVTH